MVTIKKTDNVKKHFIRLRVTEKEHDIFVRKAKEMGYKTVSDYIRTLIDDETELKDNKKNTD